MHQRPSLVQNSNNPNNSDTQNLWKRRIFGLYGNTSNSFN